jgi:hypothetical protein
MEQTTRPVKDLASPLASSNLTSSEKGVRKDMRLIAPKEMVMKRRRVAVSLLADLCDARWWPVVALGTDKDPVADSVAIGRNAATAMEG